MRASVIVAYLNIEATRVSGNLSMFSYPYLGTYLTVAGVVPLSASIPQASISSSTARPAINARPSSGSGGRSRLATA
jgi:hypothetical protein